MKQQKFQTLEVSPQIPCPRSWQGCKFSGKDMSEVAQHIAGVHKPRMSNGETYHPVQIEMSLRASLDRAANAKPKGRRAA